MEERSPITPIIVLGSARNGTTWLCNILAGHSDVAAAQHIVHWGFHESNLLKNTRYWGDLTKLDERVRFLNLYTASDHVRLVEATRDTLEGAIADRLSAGRSVDFLDVFFRTMDEFAHKRNTAYWLTKLDPLYYVYPRDFRAFLKRIEEQYGERVRFVAIQRTLSDVLRSYINMQGRGSQKRTSPWRMPGFVLLETTRYVVHYRAIRRFVRARGVPFVTYDDLRRSTEATIRSICDDLGLPYESRLHVPRFSPNSSVASRSRVRNLGIVTKMIAVGILAPLMDILMPLSRGIVRIRERTRTARPPIYFKLTKLERYPREFRRELMKTDDIALAITLFPEDKDDTDE